MGQQLLASQRRLAGIGRLARDGPRSLNSRGGTFRLFALPGEVQAVENAPNRAGRPATRNVRNCRGPRAAPGTTPPTRAVLGGIGPAAPSRKTAGRGCGATSPARFPASTRHGWTRRCPQSIAPTSRGQAQAARPAEMRISGNTMAKPSRASSGAPSPASALVEFACARAAPSGEIRSSGSAPGRLRRRPGAPRGHRRPPVRGIDRDAGRRGAWPGDHPRNVRRVGAVHPDAVQKPRRRQHGS